MRGKHRTPLKGLLAGLLSLLAFAAFAVGLTLGGSSSSTVAPAQVATTQNTLTGAGARTDLASVGDGRDGGDRDGDHDHHH